MGNIRDHDVPRIGALLEARCHVGGVADRCVVHSEIAANASDHDQTCIDSLTHVKIDAAVALKLVTVGFQRLPDAQRCMDSPLRMVLVRDRRAKESHDAVTEKMINGPLVPMDLAQHKFDRPVY
jgi:hypothetical protein